MAFGDSMGHRCQHRPHGATYPDTVHSGSTGPVQHVAPSGSTGHSHQPASHCCHISSPLSTAHESLHFPSLLFLQLMFTLGRAAWQAGGPLHIQTWSGLIYPHPKENKLLGVPRCSRRCPQLGPWAAEERVPELDLSYSYTDGYLGEIFLCGMLKEFVNQNQAYHFRSFKS